MRSREFAWVSGIAEIDELRAFNDSSAIYVEAGDDSLGYRCEIPNNFSRMRHGEARRRFGGEAKSIYARMNSVLFLSPW